MHEAQATTTRTPFRLAISVAILVEAPAATIWRLLTDLHAQATWNSTLASIDGKVALGKRVSFTVPEAPRQTFSPTVVAYDEGNRWSGGSAAGRCS
jgi:uncharacterized protein YndB with AHSA1/START domain